MTLYCAWLPINAFSLGIQGFETRIDRNGSAMGNYTLLALQEVEPVTDPKNASYYPFNAALTVTADFVYEGVLPMLRFKHAIQWVRGKPPLDEPKCGFYGEKCSVQKDEYYCFAMFSAVQKQIYSYDFDRVKSSVQKTLL